MAGGAGGGLRAGGHTKMRGEVVAGGTLPDYEIGDDVARASGRIRRRERLNEFEHAIVAGVGYIKVAGCVDTDADRLAHPGGARRGMAGPESAHTLATKLVPALPCPKT